eukprot:TRINITY_DN12116_c0_g1_i1.p1 TRINITY_DN12116_c0_g1~~TRINITY_DN12116_c0_g1_i1.p1  ORF type:complete len:1609 (-),score=370.52 TRINITY_DN12116_c0_g1_i1:51-4877(-)
MAINSRSAYRNIFGTNLISGKRLSYENLDVLSSGENDIFGLNDRYFGLPWSCHGFSGVSVFDFGDTGKVNTAPSLFIQPQRVSCLSLNPYVDRSSLVTGGGDGIIRLFQWDFMISTNTEATIELTGTHTTPVTVLGFHPSAENVLLSGCTKGKLGLWDLNQHEQILNFETGAPKAIMGISWSGRGDQFSTIAKDKCIKLFDPRSQKEPVCSTNGHESLKASRVVWMGDTKYITTTGFNRQGFRELKVWDITNMENCLKSIKFDTGAGHLLPHYSEDNNLMFLGSKGDGVIRFLEFAPETSNIISNVGKYTSNDPTSGLCLFPKRVCSMDDCEIARFLKLSIDQIDTLRFCVPRKRKDLFHEDLYPPVLSGKPSLTPDEWFNGEDRELERISLKEEGMTSVYEVPESEGGKMVVISEESESESESEEDIDIVENTGFTLGSNRIRNPRAFLATRSQTTSNPSENTSPIPTTKKQTTESTPTTWMVRPASAMVSSGFLGNSRSNTRRNQYISKKPKSESSISAAKEEHLLQGYLRKQKPGLIKSWDTRWFKLVGSKVYYFISKEHSNSLACINLEDVIEIVPKSGKCTFSVSMPNRDFILKATSEKIMMEWVHRLRETKENITLDRKSAQIKYEGYLNKKNPFGVGWKKRWFYITEEDILYYKEKPSSSDVLGSVHMDKVFSVNESDQKLQFHIDTDSRTFLLQARTVAEKTDWINYLNKSIPDDTDVLLNDERFDHLLETQNTLSGYLLKKNPNGVGWKKRWFDITGDSLCYYKEENGRQLRKINLCDISKVVKEKKNDKGILKKEESCVLEIHDSHANRIYYLTASTPQERDEWVFGLESLRSAYHDIEVLSDESDEEDYSEEETYEDNDVQSNSMTRTQPNASNTISNTSSSGGWVAATKTTTTPETKVVRKQRINYYEEYDMDSDIKVKPFIIDLNQVKNGEYVMLLQCFTVGTTLYCKQVPTVLESLSSQAAYVLDCGNIIYHWNGLHSTRLAKAKALDIASRLKFKERGGNALMILLDQGKEDREPEAKIFWDSLDCDTPVDIPNVDINFEALADQLDNSTKLYLFKESKNTKRRIALVHTGKPNKDILNPKYCYLLDCFTEIFIWIGSSSKLPTRRLILKFATKLQNEPDRPEWTGITRVFENGETILFKDKVIGYPGMLPISMKATEAKGNVADKKVQLDIDVEKLFTTMVYPEEELFIDDGRGIVKIWVVESFGKEEYPEELYGHFFSKDSYVILYKTVEENKREQKIIYFWQGRDSAIIEKGASALLTIELDKELEGEAVQIRTQQGNEPKHLVSMFGGNVITHTGKYSEYDSNIPHIYRVAMNPFNQIYCVEELYSPDSFYSKHCFVVRNYVWIGKDSNIQEKDIAENVCQMLIRLDNISANVSIVNQTGSTPKGLQKLIKGNITPTLATSNPVRFFKLGIVSGVIEAHEVVPFTQDDLDRNTCVILDTGGVVFVWIGSNAYDRVKKFTMETAENYAKMIPNVSQGRNQPEVLVVRTHTEPIDFRIHFNGWSVSKYPENHIPIVGSSYPIVVELEKYQRTTYPYQRLLMDPLPVNVDGSILESYLTDDEFVEIFQMAREEYDVLLQWQKDKKKKEVFLY